MAISAFNRLVKAAHDLIRSAEEAKPPPKPPMQRTSKDREHLTEDEAARVYADHCPDCDGKGFLAGPSGGGSQNFKCANPSCGSRFNDMGPFGIDRISDAKPDAPMGEPEGQPYRGVPSRFDRGDPV